MPQLGQRGGGWVVLQFAVMGAVVACVLLAPRWPEGARSGLSVAGAVLAIAGGALAVASARALGKSLTPFPRPSAPAVFVERGPYRLVRHPIYLGGILFFGGFALAFSPWALLAAALLTIVWALKLRVEERLLEARYPEYAGYRRRTPARLAPFVY